MSLLEYVRSKFIFLLINGFIFMLIAALMMIVKVSLVIIFLVWCIWFVPLISYMLIEYFKYKSYFDALQAGIEDLDKPYLISEVIEEPSSLEGQIIHELLSDITKAMHEHVNQYKQREVEYREYIEVWVHEIKTPIASCKLVLENNSSDMARKVTYELKRVEGFIEQVLYYARSQDVSQDYMVKEFALKDSVMKVIRENSRDFIYRKVTPQLDSLDGIIFSDAKWVHFILNQVIGNAVKYSKAEGGCIHFTTMEYEQSIVLKIRDEGVGINEKDLPRVFDKGFTGENGRLFGKSTGIGLYLCQKLCEKLRIGLSIESDYQVGTTVYLTFPKGKFAFLNER